MPQGLSFRRRSSSPIDATRRAHSPRRALASRFAGDVRARLRRRARRARSPRRARERPSRRGPARGRRRLGARRPERSRARAAPGVPRSSRWLRLPPPPPSRPRASRGAPRPGGGVARERCRERRLGAPPSPRSRRRPASSGATVVAPRATTDVPDAPRARATPPPSASPASDARDGVGTRVVVLRRAVVLARSPRAGRADIPKTPGAVAVPSSESPLARVGIRPPRRRPRRGTVAESASARVAWQATEPQKPNRGGKRGGSR